MTVYCWLCTTMVALVFWIACTRSGCTCCHLHCLRCLQNARATSWSSVKWNHERQPGWSCDFCVIMASKQSKIEFSRTFHPFIKHHDADAVHRRTPRSLDVTVLTHAGWYGLSGFEIPVAGQLCVPNVTHACLFAKCATPLQYLAPQPCGKQPRSGSAVLLDKNHPVCFSVLQKWY